MDALLLQCPDHALDHAVLLWAVWGDRVDERRGSAPGKLKAAARAWALVRLGKADDRVPVSFDAEIVGQFARMGHHEDASDPGTAPGVPVTEAVR